MPALTTSFLLSWPGSLGIRGFVDQCLPSSSSGLDWWQSEARNQVCELLVEYFDTFGSKAVCASDLKLFLPTMEESHIQQFFQRALQTIKFDEAGVPVDMDHVQKHVCWHQMKRLVGGHNFDTTVESRSKLAEALCGQYDACLPMIRGLTPTEIPANDGYALLAGHLLWDLWTETGDDKFFWKAVVFLECISSLSPANYAVKFILIKFFNHTGAVGPSTQVYNSLDLKQIQLDSLGYLMARHLQSCAHFDSSSDLFDNALRFYGGNYKETIDYIMSAYRCGSFDKIREFIKLRERLSSSLHYSSVSVEKKLSDLALTTESHASAVQMTELFEVDPVKDYTLTTELSDNRDFRPVASWEHAERSLTDDHISESFVQDHNFLRLRALILRCLAVSVYMSVPEMSAAKSASNSAASSATSSSNSSVSPFIGHKQ